MDLLAIVLRPLAALALFATAALLAWGLKKAIPEGRLKQVLYKKYSLTGEGQSTKDSNIMLLYLLGAIVLQFAIIGFFWWI